MKASQHPVPVSFDCPLHCLCFGTAHLEPVWHRTVIEQKTKFDAATCIDHDDSTDLKMPTLLSSNGAQMESALLCIQQDEATKRTPQSTAF